MIIDVFDVIPGSAICCRQFAQGLAMPRLHGASLLLSVMQNAISADFGGCKAGHGTSQHFTAGWDWKKLGVTGLSCVTDAACASSFHALDLVYDKIQPGKVECALVGGATVMFGPKPLLMERCETGVPLGDPIDVDTFS